MSVVIVNFILDIGDIKMINKINEIQKKFAYFGFTFSPLTRRKIASLLIRGFDVETIYAIGCDNYCGDKI